MFTSSPIAEESIHETCESDEAESSPQDDASNMSFKTSILESISNQNVQAKPLTNFKSNSLEKPVDQSHKSLFGSLLKINSKANTVETTLTNIQYLEQ